MNNQTNEAVIAIVCNACESRLSVSVYGWTAIACKCGHEIRRSAVCLADDPDEPVDDIGWLSDRWLATWHDTQFQAIDDHVCRLVGVGSASVSFDGSVRVDCADGWRYLTRDEIDRFVAACEQDGEFRRPRQSEPKPESVVDASWLDTWHASQLDQLDGLLCELLDLDSADASGAISGEGWIDVCDADGWRPLRRAEWQTFRECCEESVFYTQPALSFADGGRIDRGWQGRATLQRIQVLQLLAASMFDASRATLYTGGQVRVTFADGERLLNQSECDQLIAEFKQAA